MAKQRFVVCVDNSGYEASLERRKLYEALSDRKAEKLGTMRVIDESGEDYIYPSAFFEAVELRAPVQKKLLAAA